MARSTYKKKHFKKQNNKTIKLRGGSSFSNPRSKCPYCSSDFAHANSVYSHCKTHHPGQPPPSAEQIRSCSMSIPRSSSRPEAQIHDVTDKVGQYMALAASGASAAASRAPVAASRASVAVDHSERLRQMQPQPHPFVVSSGPAASSVKVVRDLARKPDPAAIASMADAARDNYPVPPDIFYDHAFTSDLMYDPVIACGDGYTYERKNILEWFNRGNTTSPTTGAPMSTQDLIPNMSLRSAIDAWATSARRARAVQGRVRAAIVAATAPPSTKGRPATY